MRNQGFTLVEVIVAMAIVSIMAGILVPLSYRIWETKEVEVTRGRMETLKMAMVGDPEMYQQGIRTDYGFVGNNGELPGALADLVTDDGSYTNWQGPYLSAGLDLTTYDRDAWGEDLVYSTGADAFGRLVSATLVSKGPDRTLGTADDIDATSAPVEQVSSADVTPTNDIQGNLAYTVSVSNNDETPNYYANVTAQYQDVGGLAVVQASNCAALNVGLVQPLIPRSAAINYNGLFPLNLPVGKVVFKSRIFENATCTGPPLVESDGMAFFVSHGLTSIYVNLPTLYHHIANGP